MYLHLFQALYNYNGYFEKNIVKILKYIFRYLSENKII